MNVLLYLTLLCSLQHMALSENPKVITALFQEECDIWDTITPQ
jgi:hypothetical protein